ncbi:MAG: RNA ligase family protein, partial [Thermus sp.]
MSAPYPKPLRLPVGPSIPSKRYLSLGETLAFMAKPLIAEEKLDGTQAMLAYGHLLLHVEDMLWRKTVPYRVPARYALFDVLDLKGGYWWSREDKEAFMEEVLRGDHPELWGKVFLVPLLHRGRFSLEEVPGLAEVESRYGDGVGVKVEGLVFKREGRVPMEAREVVRAKFVRAEFYSQFTEEKVRGRNPIQP